MTDMPFFPKSYEDVISLVGDRGEAALRMMEYFRPLTSEEKSISTLLRMMGPTGKIVFLYGLPGSGKSTFIESLSFRKHLGISRVSHINAEMMHSGNGLMGILDAFNEIISRKHETGDDQVPVIVIDYLESLDGYKKADVKALFRGFNGVLRSSKALVIWPVTDRDDMNAMLQVANNVSGTIFIRNREHIELTGPPVDEFPEIAETTLKVMNDGHTLEDMSLTRGELSEVNAKVKRMNKSERRMRRYYQEVEELWVQNTSYIAQILESTPKPTEIWLTFPYAGAESVTRNFCKKSSDVASSWLATHDSLFEYVGVSQRAAFWNAKKLQIAIYGAFRVRIMYMPTHSLIAAVRSNTDNEKLIEIIDDNSDRTYGQKAKARTSIKTSPTYRQLIGDPPIMGKRKSGPAAIAEIAASKPYAALTKWISGGKGSDRPLNHAVARCLSDALQDNTSIEVQPECPHPFIPNITPDILVTDPDRHICIEFHYTNQAQPNRIADYTLDKLKTYMEMMSILASADG